MERRLWDALGPLEIEATRGPRDAGRIAQEGVRAGVERLVVAGGDGTLSEVVTELGRARLLAKLPTIYRGEHLKDPGMQLHRGRVLEAEASAGVARLDVDGESLGTLPARIEILPGAVTLIGCAS